MKINIYTDIRLKNINTKILSDRDGFLIETKEIIKLLVNITFKEDIYL